MFLPMRLVRDGVLGTWGDCELRVDPSSPPWIPIKEKRGVLCSFFRIICFVFLLRSILQISQDCDGLDHIGSPEHPRLRFFSVLKRSQGMKDRKPDEGKLFSV